MLTLIVPTMTCSGCAAAIRQALQPVTGVESIAIDLAEKRVRVSGPAQPEAVRAAIAEAGFEIAA